MHIVVIGNDSANDAADAADTDDADDDARVRVLSFLREGDEGQRVRRRRHLFAAAQLELEVAANVAEEAIWSARE